MATKNKKSTVRKPSNTHTIKIPLAIQRKTNTNAAIEESMAVTEQKPVGELVYRIDAKVKTLSATVANLENNLCQVLKPVAPTEEELCDEDDDRLSPLEQRLVAIETYLNNLIVVVSDIKDRLVV